MRKKVIDPAHLLVILNQQEAEVFGLNTRMGWGSPPCRLAMARLFAAASEGTDFVLGHGQITIRAVQSEDGRLVLLFSSVFPSKGKMPGERKLFRIKNQPGPYIYSFSSCEDVMKVLERLCTIRRNGCTGRIDVYKRQTQSLPAESAQPTGKQFLCQEKNRLRQPIPYLKYGKETAWIKQCS